MTGVLAAAGAMSGAKFSGAMVAANISTNVGYTQAGGGSMSPSAFAGGTITELLKITSGPSLVFVINVAVNLGQSYFANLIVNGIQWASSAAVYNFTSPNNQWTWSGNPGFISGNTYPVLIY